MLNQLSNKFCILCGEKLNNRRECDICGRYGHVEPICTYIEMSHHFTSELRCKLRYKIKKGTLIFKKDKTQNNAILILDNMQILDDIDKNVKLPTLLEKIDLVLEYIYNNTKYFNQNVKIDSNTLFPLFFCLNNFELTSILKHLSENNYIKLVETPIESLKLICECKDDDFDMDTYLKNYDAAFLHQTKLSDNFYRYETQLMPLANVSILPKGIEYILNKQTNYNSDKCFVAMWFNDKEDIGKVQPNMKKVYENAIKTAIEDTKYVPVRIDYQEHCNDINDEMIAEIRKSKFIIADLTGYRGGVYFEAGFAFGLGLPVIYTCHETWLAGDKEKNIEPVHFDLNHRNIIIWNENKLEDFSIALKNRIGAVIGENFPKKS